MSRWLDRTESLDLCVMGRSLFLGEVRVQGSQARQLRVWSGDTRPPFGGVSFGEKSRRSPVHFRLNSLRLGQSDFSVARIQAGPDGRALCPCGAGDRSVCRS